LNKIELAIETLNQTFEFYFEEYPEIDESPIWWTQLYDPQKKVTKIVHITNFCKKPGDLAIHFFRNGYCAVYANILKELFPEGTIYENMDHMIFLYEGNFYDAGKKIQVKPNEFMPVTDPISPQDFSKYPNAESPSIIHLTNLMKQEAKKVLQETPESLITRELSKSERE